MIKFEGLRRSDQDFYLPEEYHRSGLSEFAFPKYVCIGN